MDTWRMMSWTKKGLVKAAEGGAAKIRLNERGRTRSKPNEWIRSKNKGTI